MAKRERVEGWLGPLRKALIHEGATVRKIAKRIAEGLDAEFVEVAKHEGQITDERMYVDHVVRLRAVTTAVEIFAPRVAGRDGEPRLMLNVQAGANIQLVYFGEAKGEVPEAQGATVTIPAEPMSPTAKQHLIRSGQLLPDGTAPPTAKASDEAKALPEAKDRDEKFLR